MRHVCFLMLLRCYQSWAHPLHGGLSLTCTSTKCTSCVVKPSTRMLAPRTNARSRSADSGASSASKDAGTSPVIR